MRSARVIPFMLLLVTLAGCKPSLPSDVISEGKMERVLHDFHLAQGMVEHVPRQPGEDYDVMRYELVQAVFHKYGITQEDFDRSMVYYLSDMSKLAAIYKNVADRLEREAEALGVAAGPRDAYAALTAEGDTANVWADRALFAVRNSQGYNFQMWSQECDSTWQPGDDLMWRFELKQVTHAYGVGDLFVDFVVRYDNDSVCSRLMNIGEARGYEIRIDNPGNLTPKHVSGHLFTPVLNDPAHARLYVVYMPSLIRFHKTSADNLGLSDSDSLALPDSLAADSLVRTPADSLPLKRLTPEQLRDSKPVDRTIDVVKEKPYAAPRRGTRKRFAEPRRQR